MEHRCDILAVFLLLATSDSSDMASNVSESCLLGLLAVRFEPWAPWIEESEYCPISAGQWAIPGAALPSTIIMR